jgi:hypothetical protein
MVFKKEGTHFTNKEGKFDVKKLLAASPKFLSKFIHRSAHADADDTGSGSGNMATATLNVLAAIAHADQRPHYTPHNSQDLVQDLAVTAQNTLDLSAGLNVTPGQSPFPDHQYPSGVNPNAAKKSNIRGDDTAQNSDPKNHDGDA